MRRYFVVLLLLAATAMSARAQELGVDLLGGLSHNQDMHHPAGMRASVLLAPNAELSPRLGLEYMHNSDTFVGSTCGAFDAQSGSWCPLELNRTHAHMLTVTAGIVLHGRADAAWSPRVGVEAMRARVLDAAVVGTTTGRLLHPAQPSAPKGLLEYLEPNGVRFSVGVRRSRVLHRRLSAELGYAFRDVSPGTAITDGYAPFDTPVRLHELYLGAVWRLRR